MIVLVQNDPEKDGHDKAHHGTHDQYGACLAHDAAEIGVILTGGAVPCHKGGPARFPTKLETIKMITLIPLIPIASFSALRNTG